jgi:hypothetical protein
MADWQQTYDPRDLNYLSRKAKQIRDTATLLGVPALGLVGGVAREMMYARKADPWWATFSAPIKEFVTSNEVDTSAPATMPGEVWKPITHQTLAEGFARSNLPGGGIGPGATNTDLAWLKLGNPVLWDVGPGHIHIRTGITMLQNYNQMFPDSDPLNLKQYNQRYDLLVRDLKDPASDATIKIAGLVAREGQDFYRKAMTPERWAMLSEDQRAAALTQYYVAGKERMQADFQQRGGDPNTFMPDLSRVGSNTYFYDPGNGNWSNPALLKDALAPRVRTENDPDTQPSRTADFASGMNNAPMQQVSAAQRTDSPVPSTQPGSAALPPQVVANGNYLRANGFEITPRTMYVAHVIGPERAVDLFRRTGSTASPDVPSPDAATGEQMRAWARALRGYGSAPAVGVAPTADAGPAIANDSTADARDATGFPQ